MNLSNYRSTIHFFGFLLLCTSGPLQGEQASFLNEARIAQHEKQALAEQKKITMLKTGAFVAGASLAAYCGYKYVRRQRNPQDVPVADNRPRAAPRGPWHFISTGNEQLNNYIDHALCGSIIGIGTSLAYSIVNATRKVVGDNSFFDHLRAYMLPLDSKLLHTYKELHGMIIDLGVWADNVYGASESDADYAYFKKRFFSQRAYLKQQLEHFVGYAAAISTGRGDGVTHAWLLKKDSTLFESAERLAADIERLVQDKAALSSLHASLKKLSHAIDNVLDALFMHLEKKAIHEA
jgi:hypothetical protein